MSGGTGSMSALAAHGLVGSGGLQDNDEVSTFMAKYLARKAGLRPSDYRDMDDLLTEPAAVSALVDTPEVREVVVVSTTGSASFAAYEESAQQVANSEDFASMFVESDASFSALQSSETMIGAFDASMVGMSALVSSLPRLNELFASEFAMNRIGSEIAVNAVLGSTDALLDLGTNAMAVGKFAASAAGLNPEDYQDVYGLMDDGEALDVLSSSVEALGVIQASAIAMSAVSGGDVRSLFGGQAFADALEQYGDYREYGPGTHEVGSALAYKVEISGSGGGGSLLTNVSLGGGGDGNDSTIKTLVAEGGEGATARLTATHLPGADGGFQAPDDNDGVLLDGIVGGGADGGDGQGSDAADGGDAGLAVAILFGSDDGTVELNVAEAAITRGGPPGWGYFWMPLHLS